MAMKRYFGEIAGCRKLPSKDVLISFKTEAEAQKARTIKNAQELFGVEAKVTKWHDAKRTFAIYGYPTSVSEEELTHYAKTELNIELKICNVLNPKSEKTTIFVEASEQCDFEALSKLKYFNLGYERCLIAKVRQKILRQCKKCFGFDHTAKNCTNESSCRICTGAHNEKECPEKIAKCKNCSGKHASDSKICPSFIAYRKRKLHASNKNRFSSLFIEENEREKKLQKDGTPFPYGYPLKQKRKKSKIHVPTVENSAGANSQGDNKHSNEEHEQARKNLLKSKQSENNFEKLMEMLYEQNKNILNMMSMMMTTLTTLVNSLNQKNASQNNRIPSSF
ncbi:hypothetical protein MHBO_003347 [Bonamia ostreae]|uniref:Nucleic-acid-binding protein from transposon X-element n=1 Tax=Bonamia ostreae TaxID=126728 RepID=A0ABV2AQ51_9EUKA